MGLVPYQWDVYCPICNISYEGGVFADSNNQKAGMYAAKKDAMNKLNNHRVSEHPGKKTPKKNKNINKLHP